MPTTTFKTCSYCSKEVDEEELDEHHSSCGVEEVECGNGCGQEMPRYMHQQHMEESCKKRKVQCHYCSASILFNETEDHKQQCSIEIVESQLMCAFHGERFTVPNHMLESYPRSLEACPYCTQAVKKSDMDEHVAKCEEAMSRCDKCGKNVPKENIDVHLKEYCSKRDKECIFCGTSVVENTMHEHNKVCDLLETHQPQCSKVMKSSSDISLADKCVIREVQCVFCDSFVQEVSLAKHYDTCETAIVHCGNKCGVKISRKDLSEHYQNECLKALVVCEHCEKEVERHLLKDHQAECVKFQIPCPESCGVEVAREDVEQHLDEECQKLFSACAYKKMQCSYEGFPAGMKRHLKEGVQYHMGLLKGIAENLQFKLESEKQINQDVKCKMENLQLELESEKKRNQELQGLVENLEFRLKSVNKGYQEIKGMIENLRLKLESEKKGAKVEEKNIQIKSEDEKIKHGEVKCMVENLQLELESEKNGNKEVRGMVGKLELKLESEMMKHERVNLRFENLHRKLDNEMKRNEKLQREINSLRYESMLWKVEDIAQEIKKAENNRSHMLLSPPFYSNKHGYKLRVVMCPDGNCAERKGHLGVYIQVMPGEYDSILKWPFTKSVKFRLVDQATQDKDIVRCFRRLDDEAFIKPKDGKCNDARGLSFFVSHEVLSSRSYIVDNAMFLEVSVED